MDPNTDPKALAAQNTYWNALMHRLMPGRGMQNMGLLGNAAGIAQSRPYMMHVQEAQALGQEPMSPEQFQQQMGARRGLLGM